jgi:hypothetical protein
VIQIPAVVLFAGCLLFSTAVATALWSLTQVLLERRSSGATQAHLRRALVATTIAAVVAAVPPGLSHLLLLAGVAGTL